MEQGEQVACGAYARSQDETDNVGTRRWTESNVISQRERDKTTTKNAEGLRALVLRRPSFKEPALQTLYSDISDLSFFLRCLPDDLWELQNRKFVRTVVGVFGSSNDA